MSRSSMAALITRTRLLINDPSGASQNFSDDQIQDVLDFSREDVRYMLLTPGPTYSGGTLTYLDYYASIGDWETDYTFSQWYTNTVTPSSSEPIAGHFVFSTSTIPPVYIVGKTYDLYKGAADLLERWAAQWLQAYSVMVDGQKLERQQIAQAMRDQAKQYRMQQRARSANAPRNDLNTGPRNYRLGPRQIDYITTG